MKFPLKNQKSNCHPRKVLIHQYAGDIANGLFDFNQINPFLDNPELVIQRLILPPA